MDLLGDPLTTHPTKMGWEISIELYPSWQIECIENLYCQSGCGLVWTRTRTCSNSPELLLTLIRTGIGVSILERNDLKKNQVMIMERTIRRERHCFDFYTFLCFDQDEYELFTKTHTTEWFLFEHQNKDYTTVRSCEAWNIGWLCTPMTYAIVHKLIIFFSEALSSKIIIDPFIVSKERICELKN